METKRRQQQQQQLCVQALHHQSVGNHCTHGAPLGYLPSPWVVWDAGRLAEATRRRKQKKRFCTACLLAGVAVAVLAVAGVAGLAVYLGGSPPTDSSTKWESFRRAGEPRPGEEITTHRLHNRHGILFRADPTERTTPPARSPWAVRREEGVRWEGRGGGAAASPGEIPREEDHVDFPYEESEGIPEVEVVLEGGEGGEASRTESQSARSPFARASEGRRPPVPPGTLLPEASGSPFPSPAGERESLEGNGDAELATNAEVRETTANGTRWNQGEEGEKGAGVRRSNEWHWESDSGEDGGIYGDSLEEREGSEEADEEDEDGLEEEVREEEGEEEVAEEEKEGVGEERRQQHASNKLATEGIPVFNMLTKILKRLNSSSIPKEVEATDIRNGTIECSPGQFRCATANEGIMCLPATSRCDGVRDCTLSGEDETGCNCADTLRSRFLHRKLCDGVPDCWDYSDEDQCEWCTPGHLVCGGGARTCVEPKRICDGVKDCPEGDDESRCIALYSGEDDEEQKMIGPEARKVYQSDSNWSSPARGLYHVTSSMLTNKVLPYRSSGYLLVRKKGVWGKLCVDGSGRKEKMQNKDSSEVSWDVAEIGHKVCQAMTHRDFETVEQVTDEKNKDINSSNSFPPYYTLQQSSSNTDILESMQSLHTTDCSSKKIMRVKCKDLECGVRPKVRLNQWSRIVGGGNAAPGAWPWQAALYREGEFQCGGTLISDHWLVTAGHCFFHARDDYWVARLGTLRRGTDLPSPHEQRRPLSTIILHPGYVDAGFLNDIALLRLSSPVEITDHVRPACLPPRAIHIQTSSIEERDEEQTTSEEITSYSYDETITTFPPLLNTYEGIPTDVNTDIPYTNNYLNDLKSNTPTKGMSLWESTLEDGNEHTESNSTSTQQYVSDVQKQTTDVMVKHDDKQLKEEYSAPIFSNTRSTESDQTLQVVVHAAYTSIDNQDSNAETLTPAISIHIDESNEDETGEHNTEEDTIQTKNSKNRTFDEDEILNLSTELASFGTESITPQFISTRPVSEGPHSKEFSSHESSRNQETYLNLTNNDKLPSDQNPIQTAEGKGKPERDYTHIDESIKTTLSDANSIPNNQNYHTLEEKTSFTTKHAPVKLEKYTYNNTEDINSEEQSTDFSISKTNESHQLKSKIQVEQDALPQQVPETIEVTSPNTLKMEHIYKYIKHIKKSQDALNILVSDDKIIDTKNANKTLPSTQNEFKIQDQENSTSVKYFPSSTEPITFDPTAKETLTESAKPIVRERKARDIDADDTADDGIRNGRLCTVVGWGQLFEVGRIFPDTLQEVELPLISTSECRKRTLFLPLYHLTDAMFCAGYDRGGRDACLGDSGGPLMCQESNGHWSLYGVTSNGYGCARANRPGVYTKVSHYIPWMEESMSREDAAQEEKWKEDERRGKEAVGGGEGWKQRWEWRKRRGEEQGFGGKHYCPHRCPLGECLQRARVCNGVVDCSDASDEQNCQSEMNVGR